MLEIEMINKFQPLIEKKARKAAGKYHISERDYAQGLYVKLLEKISKNKAVSEKYLYKVLYETNPTNDDRVRIGRPLDTFTPQEENEVSLKSCEQTFSQKVDAVFEIAEQVLTSIEFQVLSWRRDGKSYEKIGKIMGMSHIGVEKVLRKAFYKLNQKNIKLMLNDVFYNDNSVERGSIESVPDLFPPKKIKPTPIYNPDEIWQTVKRNWGPLDVRKELDTMLKTQTSCHELLNDKATQTKIRKKLKENPDFKFVLQLDRKCNNYTFINGARKISTELFGKNIFEFVE